MKNVSNGFVTSLRYFCLVGVIAFGLMTIVATGGGGGGGATENECGDQNLGDLSDPGKPAEPTRTETYPDPEIFLQYDDVNFDVFQKEMHNRTVTVAFANDFDLGNQERKDFSEFVFNTWAVYWKEFGGFPYDSYTILYGYDLPYGDVGAFGRGQETSSARTDYTAHEIYHSWNGNAFRQDGERTWFMEGVTTYYGNMRQQQEGYTYESIMNTFYGYYLDYCNAGQDRPLADMSMNDDDYDHTFVAQKGALVAYLLDKKLKETGHHLGEVARLIYQRYGIESVGRPTNQEFLSAFNEVSGEDFTDFFNKYIYGTEALPLDGSEFEWICHE